MRYIYHINVIYPKQSNFMLSDEYKNFIETFKVKDYSPTNVNYYLIKLFDKVGDLLLILSWPMENLVFPIILGLIYNIYGLFVFEANKSKPQKSSDLFGAFKFVLISIFIGYLFYFGYALLISFFKGG